VIPRLAAAVVNHNQNDQTLRQLQEHRRNYPQLFLETEWLVVHNGDPPPLDCDDLNVRVLHVPNRGYGAAINLAASATSAPVLLALNADLVPTPGFLAEAHRLADAMCKVNTPGKRIGMIGCRLLDDDGSPQGSFGPWPSLWRLLTGLFRPRAVRKYWLPRADKPRDVPWATGACLLLRRDFFASMDGFDERFFMYYEDVDLCRRAWKDGWRVRFEPGPTARHMQPYHSRGLTYSMARLARRSLIVYFWKHRPRWEFRVISAIVRLECFLRRGDPGWRAVGDVVRRAIAHPEEIPQTPP
jgi:GT2 family glycosyltransferase